jgi:hypothetical protein
LHQRAAWFDPSSHGTFRFPNFRVWLEYVKLVHQAPLTADERRACYVVLLKWIPMHRRRLLMDLKGAVRTAQGIVQSRRLRPA